jgi:hypothetical protein
VMCLTAGMIAWYRAVDRAPVPQPVVADPGSRRAA